MFRRRKMPDGTPIPDEDRISARIETAEKWHMDFYSWINGYLSLLEKRLYDREKRCQECQYRNCEGSACHDEVSD